MDIINFEKQHVKEAAALALANYYDELQWQFYRYGFGLRCLDAIRSMELIVNLVRAMCLSNCQKRSII